MVQAVGHQPHTEETEVLSRTSPCGLGGGHSGTGSGWFSEKYSMPSSVSSHSGHAVLGVDLRPLACRDCGFESLRV